MGNVSINVLNKSNKIIINLLGARSAEAMAILTPVELPSINKPPQIRIFNNNKQCYLKSRGGGDPGLMRNRDPLLLSVVGFDLPDGAACDLGLPPCRVRADGC